MSNVQSDTMNSRTLTFVQISDSRFSGSEQELETLSKNVLKALSSLAGVTAQTDEIRMLEFSVPGEAGKVKSWRQRFYVQKSGHVQKTGSVTTWEDVRRAVNSVKSVPYELIPRPTFTEDLLSVI